MEKMDTSTQPEVDVAQTAQPEAESQADVQGTQTEVENTENQPKFKVKYNKEEKELSFDEAREYAEKGMNYDKVLSQRDEYQTKIDQYENSKSNKLLKAMAADRGMTVEQYVDAMEISRLNKKAQEQGITVDQLKKQQEDAATKAEKDAKLARLEKFEADTLAQQEADKAAQAEIAAFREAHPDIKQLDPDVVQKWQKGVPLQEAHDMVMQAQRIAELEKQLGIKQVNDENAEASTGKLGGSAEHEPELTLERIAKMTSAEIDANWDRIEKKLFG